jgi:O-methyltransferase
MLLYENFALNLELCERFKDVKGCIVECGVWRGGMSAAMAEVLGYERTYIFSIALKDYHKHRKLMA